MSRVTCKLWNLIRSLFIGSATSTHQGWPSNSQCRVLNRPTMEINTRPTIWQHLLEAIGQLSGGRLVTLDRFFQEKGIVLFSWNRSWLWVWSCLLLPWNTSAKTAIYGLTEYLIHYHGFLHSTDAKQGIHFAANKIWQ